MKKKSGSSNSPVTAILAALDDLKAQNTVTLDVRGHSDMFDTLVVASGSSSRQVRALAQHVIEELKKKGYPPVGSEGLDTGEWALVDYGDIVVHVMQPEIRSFYDIESLWQAPAVPAPAVATGSKPRTSTTKSSTTKSSTTKTAVSKPSKTTAAKTPTTKTPATKTPKTKPSTAKPAAKKTAAAKPVKPTAPRSKTATKPATAKTASTKTTSTKSKSTAPTSAAKAPRKPARPRNSAN